MIATLGLLALAAALVAALTQSLGLLWLRLFSLPRATQTARAALLVSLQMTAVAFICLLLSFWRNDFSLRVVAENSHTLLSPAWRLAATWGNHEGSLLLWTLILAVCSLATLTLRPSADGGRGDGTRLLPLAALSVQGGVLFLFLGFSLFFSNPFARLMPAPLEGADLNPILQDPALAFHPPMLYLGYVGLSLSWTITAAGLLARADGVTIARLARPWTLAAWSALTAGLALGSWWAYYELGWGGWWFWDPVENLALMPWLVATAQVHALASAARGRFVAGALLLSLLGFLLALLATFAVRSGLLVSVHSFAIAPARGLAALAILATAGIFSLTLFALRAPRLSSSRSSPRSPPDGHDAVFLINLLLLPSLAAVVLVGTFYPLAAELFLGLRLAVGEGYYALAFVPLSLFLLPGAGLVPLWRRGVALSRTEAWRSLRAARWGWAALAATLIIVSLLTPEVSWLARFALALSVWLLVESLRCLAVRWRGARGRRMGLAAMVTAHVALALFVFSATVSRSWQWERSALLSYGERLSAPRHGFRLDSVSGVAGGNWIAEEGRVVWFRDGVERDVLRPQRRLYPASSVTTTETAIASRFLYDFHVRLGAGGDGGWRVIVLYRPLTVWLWFSATLMVLAGACGFCGLVFRRKAGGEGDSDGDKNDDDKGGGVVVSAVVNDG
ncbi:MAG: cytochrome c biogenesis protein CcsA [Alphaproteobacteria bacterium]|nr:cytochrome c biogenesis protein CcsA [Alphaproteobacteria bacterium]